MQIIYNWRIGSEQCRIRIKCGSLFIEISRTDISKTLLRHTILMPTKNQGYLSMHLQTFHAIYNMYTCFLHPFGSFQIILFIESRLQFHEHRHFLSILRSSNQRIDYFGMRCHPILSNHNFLNRGIVYRFIQEMNEVIK